MKSNDIAIRAYIAGIIDGEGHIGIKCRRPTKANKCRSAEYSIRVTVDMTDEAPIRAVASFCDVEHQVCLRKRPPNKPIFHIEISRKRAVRLLREIYPYLLGKREQADLVFKLDHLRSQSRLHRTKILGVHTFVSGRQKGLAYRVFGLSDEFTNKCELLYRELINVRRNAPDEVL